MSAGGQSNQTLTLPEMRIILRTAVLALSAGCASVPAGQVGGSPSAASDRGPSPDTRPSDTRPSQPIPRPEQLYTPAEGRLSSEGLLIFPSRAPASGTQSPGPPGPLTSGDSPFTYVDSALNLRVIYPRPRQVISVRDSTFLLGSVGSGAAKLTINGDTVPVNPNGSFLAWLPFPAGEAPKYDMVVARAADTLRSTLEVARPRPVPPALPVPLVIPDQPKFVELLNANEDAKSDTDFVAIARPTQAGTYKWFLHAGTVVQVTGERNGWTRVRLDSALDAWVESKYTKASDRTSNGRRTATNARVLAAANGDRWTDLRIPIASRVPFLVEQRADALILTLYDAASNIDIINQPTNDPSVRDVTWEQVTNERVRITVHLRHAPYGYLTMYTGGAFVLRVRHPPVVDRLRPLAGRVVAVDAGHPPIGSTGPTGLYEGDAVLAVAQALKPMLERAGATVIMTRSAAGAVALGERPIIARRADADVLVSIHLNAHPDGVNPLRNNGTGTYYFHAQAEPLAREVQRGMVKWMGLRDLGINYNNLALARPTWMPSILCEGAFIIVPNQEAALRTAEFQSRYAIGVLEGLENYFRGLAQ